MTDSWNARIDSFWADAQSSRPDLMLSQMFSLISEREENDPDGLYEWASVHDFLGLEQEAIPLYLSSINHGLTGSRRPQALIQLASSLRNVGEPEKAIELLQPLTKDETVGDASRAFLALALHDCGRHSDALRVALRALAPTLPRYGGVVEEYADALINDPAVFDKSEDSSPVSS